MHLSMWDWEALIIADAAELDHTGKGWSCLSTLRWWAGELVALIQHACLSAGTEPTYPFQRGLKRAFLCKAFWDPGRCLCPSLAKCC